MKAIEERPEIQFENSVAWQTIQRGLTAFSAIAESGLTVNSNYIASEDGRECFLALMPGGKIDLSWFWDKDPARIATGSGSLNEIVAYHVFGPNEVREKTAGQQVALAEIVLTEIGASFANASPAFKDGYKPAIEAVIAQSYGELGIVKPAAGANGGAALRFQVYRPGQPEALAFRA